MNNKIVNDLEGMTQDDLLWLNAFCNEALVQILVNKGIINRAELVQKIGFFRKEKEIGTTC